MKKALVTGGAGFLGSHLCKRLLAFASAHAKDTPASFVKNLERDLDAFTAGAEQFDDITALAVLVKGDSK